MLSAGVRGGNVYGKGKKAVATKRRFLGDADLRPSEEQLFCKAVQENSLNQRAKMLRVRGIKMPGSKETVDSFVDAITFRKWAVLLSAGTLGWDFYFILFEFSH